MKNYLILSLIPALLGTVQAQMPSSFDASGRSEQTRSGVENNDPSRVGEPVNPQLFGMEIPLLDPANDTMTYNGSKFEVENNKMVRERFEKYLHEIPDNSSESQRYRKRINEILEASNRYNRAKTVGSPILVKIGMGLLEIGKFKGDGGQATALASAMVSALDAQRANLARNRQNEQLDKDIDKLVRETDAQTTRNTLNVGKGQGGGSVGAIKAPTGGGGTRVSHTFKIAHNTQKIASKEAEAVKNRAANEANLALAKSNYQALLMSFLAQRRYDHAVIGARVYRHLFTDGDTQLKMDKESDGYKMVTGISGLPPTVNLMDTLAGNARMDVDRAMTAVYNLLAQNKLSEATERLISAVAIGEFMQSVSTFPAESRQRISHFWNLRKRGLSALNARDYGTAEKVAAEMKSLDKDFDDSLLRSYCAGKKRQSDLHIRNAMKAFKNGNEELFNKEITEAGIIWPLNPNLDKGSEQLAKIDSGEPVMDEFRSLFARKEYRTIYKEQDKFEIVATDAELKKQYRQAIEFVGTVDAMAQQLDSVAEQDKTMGPCMAYEKLVEMRKENGDYATDPRFVECLHRYESAAHEFVKSLRDAEDCESRAEYGSALSNYYRARCIYPKSNMVKAGIERVSKVIVGAKY